MVFSWTFCPFAKRAKGLLTELGATFTAVEMDQIADGKAIKAELGMVSTSLPEFCKLTGSLAKLHSLARASTSVQHSTAAASIAGL